MRKELFLFMPKSRTGGSVRSVSLMVLLQVQIWLGAKPLTEPILTKFYDAAWRHMDPFIVKMSVLSLSLSVVTDLVTI